MESSSLNNTYCYQIDLIIPNLETNFNEIEDYFKTQSFFHVTQLHLSELLDELFIATFIKNGRIYLHSVNTLIDCHDCITLKPNGMLILNLNKSSFERIPLDAKLFSSKRSNIQKYEIHIDLTDDMKKDKLSILKNSLDLFKCSFYVYWKPNNQKINVYETLKKYFGTNRVTKCLNRYEKKVKIVDNTTLNYYFNEHNLLSTHNWIQTLNFLGRLFHDIEDTTMDTDESEKEQTQISLFRIRGFFSNLIIQDIESLIKNSYGGIIHMVNLHGFRDSCVSLYNDTVRINQISRNGDENFVSIFCHNNSIDKLYFFHDFNKPFINRK